MSGERSIWKSFINIILKPLWSNRILWWTISDVKLIYVIFLHILFLFLLFIVCKHIIKFLMQTNKLINRYRKKNLKKAASNIHPLHRQDSINVMAGNYSKDGKKEKERKKKSPYRVHNALINFSTLLNKSLNHSGKHKTREIMADNQTSFSRKKSYFYLPV